MGKPQGGTARGDARKKGSGGRRARGAEAAAKNGPRATNGAAKRPEKRATNGPTLRELGALADPEASARAAGLRYVTDETPGLRRQRRGRGFSYLKPDGSRVTDETERERIAKLVVPPAWQDVWISTDPDAHLLATGRDERGRKQYIYHPKWRETRDRIKYLRMIEFGELLPAIRTQVDRDLRRKGLHRDRVLAAVVRLLERTLIRVGNDQYAEENESYGLTTIRKKHVDVEGATMHFEFTGKSGVERNVEIRDPRVARVVKLCEDTPGYELFKYLDDDGRKHDVTSDDVNDYLRRATGADVTAKDFRTWAGTLLACIALDEFQSFDDEVQAKKNVVQAVKSVAERLGNTPAICRESYIHPDVIEGYMGGELRGALKARVEEELRDRLEGLEPEEAAVLAFLKGRLESR